MVIYLNSLLLIAHTCPGLCLLGSMLSGATLISYGSLIFERGGEIGLKLEDEQSCKRKDGKSR